MADNLAAQEMTPLEQEVLEEYDKLSTNMKTVRRLDITKDTTSSVGSTHSLREKERANLGQLATLLDNLASNPTTEILDGLRDLERKTSLAFTLLKASVYSIVLQQEIDWGGDQEGGEDGRDEYGREE